MGGGVTLTLLECPELLHRNAYTYINCALTFGASLWTQAKWHELLEFKRRLSLTPWHRTQRPDRTRDFSNWILKDWQRAACFGLIIGFRCGPEPHEAMEFNCLQANMQTGGGISFLRLEEHLMCYVYTGNIWLREWPPTVDCAVTGHGSRMIETRAIWL